jgi:CRP/FNR family cyclic AMP-dependent transcriptional regulator
MKTQTLDRYLKDHEFFRGLPPADLELIAGCGRNVHLERGAFLAREGDPADFFYVIREGRVALEIHVPDRGPLVIDTVGPGEILGVSWLFPPHRWQFDARAVERTAAIWLDGACLRDKCDADPRLGYDVMKRFARVLKGRLQSARLRLLDLYGDARTG